MVDLVFFSLLLLFDEEGATTFASFRFHDWGFGGMRILVGFDKN